MKKYWKEILLGIIAIFFVIPLGIACMFNFKFIVTDTSNDWIGFWGSYFGGIIGGFVTLFVMFRTLKENRESQRMEQRINFCNNICQLSGELCAAINRKCIYIRKYADKNIDGNKEDIFNAMFADNKASELLHICSVQLISKIDDTEYKGVEKLMEKIQLLGEMEQKIDIKFAYTADDEEQLKRVCDNVNPVLGEMRDWVVEFLRSNV